MTEGYAVRYSPAARDDLKSIYSYIAVNLKEKQTAKNQTDRIRSAVRSLAQFPNRHEKVDWEPWASMGMRKMPVDRYIVFYLVDEESHTAIVTRIFYGGRDIEGMIQNKNR
ncbi:type II toxin-antitoxin system RelE/ParE family toxin [Oscillospiraceae bacterium 21-37]